MLAARVMAKETGVADTPQVAANAETGKQGIFEVKIDDSFFERLDEMDREEGERERERERVSAPCRNS